VKKWQYFRTHSIPLNSLSNSLSYDVVRFKTEVGVEEKFMCKNVTKQTQQLHCDSSENAVLHGGHMHDLYLTANMLQLCDPSNLLFVLSTEERDMLFSNYFEDLFNWSRTLLSAVNSSP